MLHNQAVYCSAWNGEHKKRCLDAFLVGHRLAGYVIVSCLKTKLLQMHKKHFLFSLRGTKCSFINTEHTAYCNIHLQWDQHGALGFRKAGLFHINRGKVHKYINQETQEKGGNRKVFNLSPVSRRKTRKFTTPQIPHCYKSPALENRAALNQCNQ